jgi:predicted phosphodiesterase
VRVRVFSDIHSNLEALTAVLDAQDGDAFDETWILGDLTGYGPDPEEVVAKVRAIPRTRIVLGNHDRVVSRLASPVGFNSHAVVAAFKNMNLLGADSAGWLSRVPEKMRYGEKAVLVHGSLLDPDEYLLTLESSRETFAQMAHQGITLLFCGHTHVQALYEWDSARNEFSEFDFTLDQSIDLPLTGNHHFIINPGSVGQPRDGNPQAGFMTVTMSDSSARVKFHRVDYPWRVCQKKLVALEFPDILVKRLALGF